MKKSDLISIPDFIVHAVLNDLKKEEQQNELMVCVFNFVVNRPNKIIKDPFVNTWFEKFKKYHQRRLVNIKNGKKGGAPKGNQNAKKKIVDLEKDFGMEIIKTDLDLMLEEYNKKSEERIKNLKNENNNRKSGIYK